ncbi:MAG: hypothetical protein AAGJ18_11890, partial [Bacteroidota bacterium]
LMMGILLIFVGLLHLSLLRQTAKNSYPLVGGSVLMIGMLVFVIYAGYHFFSAWQVYGGSFGLIIQTVCLILTVRNN